MVHTNFLSMRQDEKPQPGKLTLKQLQCQTEAITKLSLCTFYLESQFNVPEKVNNLIDELAQEFLNLQPKVLSNQKTAK